VVTTIILGAYYMLKMYQHVMLGKLTKSFSDVSFKEGLALVIIACLILWNVSKPITDLMHKFRKYFNLKLTELTSQIKK
jgi:NADH-quinone oxidoreductase subunit M